MATYIDSPAPAPGPLPGDGSVFHDPARRDMAMRSGGLILLAAAAAMILASGFARHELGPPLPASLSDVVLAAPRPASGLDLPAGTPVMGRWTLVCSGETTCRNADAAVTELSGAPFQAVRVDGVPRKTMALLDPLGRIYARLDADLPRLDLAGLMRDTARHFDRSVLARLF